jgi:N-acetylneuraminic acid mutarotase
MPTVRILFFTSEVNGKIYAIGGYDGIKELSTVEEYDPMTDKWVRKADMPTSRIQFSGCAVNGKIYAIGGSNDKSYFSIVEEYDPEASENVNFKGKLPTTWGEMRTAMSK